MGNEAVMTVGSIKRALAERFTPPTLEATMGGPVDQPNQGTMVVRLTRAQDGKAKGFVRVLLYSLGTLRKQDAGGGQLATAPVDLNVWLVNDRGLFLRWDFAQAAKFVAFAAAPYAWLQCSIFAPDMSGLASRQTPKRLYALRDREDATNKVALEALRKSLMDKALNPMTNNSRRPAYLMQAANIACSRANAEKAAFGFQQGLVRGVDAPPVIVIDNQY